MGHRCCSKQRVKRGLWSPEEDEKLINHITTFGHGCWSTVPKLAGLQRCGKSCRLRWINYLRPDLRRGSFSEEEERIIIDVHRIIGNRWAQIAKHLPGRTDNEVKNFWNSCIKKKLIAQGLDPNTHNLISPTQPKTKHNNSKSHKISSSSSAFTIHHKDNTDDVVPMEIKATLAATLPPFPNITPSSMDITSNNNNNNNLSSSSSSSNNLSAGFGIFNSSSYNCGIWGGATNLELLFGGNNNNERQQEVMRQQQQEEEEKGNQVYKLNNTEFNNNHGQSIDINLFDNSNIGGIEFVESEIMPCGAMYCNANSMDQLAWDC